jgi:uncharacterized repeat protein (TIGR01451 family)
MDGGAAHAKAACRRLLAGGAFLLAALAQAATPPGTEIANTATASFRVAGVSVTVSGTATVTTSISTPASVQLLAYAPTAQGMPGPVVSNVNVPPAQCARNGSFTPLPAPRLPGVGVLQTGSSLPLTNATIYASGDVVFVQVTDFDQNRDPHLAETVTLAITTSKGDSETLRLVETGPSTGVFAGYIPTARGAVQAGDCVLDIASNQKVVATYVDQSESSAQVAASALIDPLGLVFDSATGEPVNGARVTILDARTNLPAKVLGNDGVSSYPSTIVAGSRVQDSGGTTYDFAPGRYQFPRLAPGTYRFAVEPPQGYKFASTALETALRALPGAPFAIANGSRGEPFTLVPGPAIEMDIPVDPGPLGELNILKSAAKATAGVGDFVPYTVQVGNRGTLALPDVVIGDRMPLGFRYQKGSARLNSAPLADPQVSADGRSLQFALGILAGSGNAVLRYVLQVGPGTPMGPAENIAQSVGRITSNVAKASVQVRDDLNASRAILTGRVMLAKSCEQDERQPGAVQGLKDVRILLQDGTTILSDAEGNWHAENLRPGTHVVQVDTTTLPAGMELRNCDPSSRTGGRNFSQLVNVRAGTLWRADFRLVPAASCMAQAVQRSGRRIELALSAPLGNESLSATVVLPAGAKVAADSVQLDGRAAAAAAQASDGMVVVRLPAQPARWEHKVSFELDGPAQAELKALVRVQPVGQPASSLQPLLLPAGEAQARQCAPMPVGGLASRGSVPQAPNGERGPALEAAPSLLEQLPYDDKWLAAAAPGNEWMHPQADFSPALPVIKVAVKHARGTTLELKVNGSPVNPLRFEGTVGSPTGEWLLSQWRSVDLRDGPNHLALTVRDAQGMAVLQETRTIHYSTAPVRVELDLEHSRLVADGRSSPVLAVRMLDQLGKPARRGLIGDFQVNPPYVPQELADALQRDPLTGTPGGRPRFVIGEKGIALIPLQPTTQSGEVVLRFPLSEGRTQEVRAWLNADLREWVLVGFAEGTLGHKSLSGNMEALKGSGADDQLFDDNRLAFYAKGRIRGDYLLTAAYDSAKRRGPRDAPALKQAIDPTQYYTLYADASQAQYDAASTRKLYLKIEKKQFYALFGDFDSGLTVSELGRYSRTLNGLKSEYKGEVFSYNAFATRTSQSFLKDELQGDGTSGLYRLRTRNILVNSEKVRIEVRDRFHPDQVLSVRTLATYLDYQIDYVAGTLFFREPVPSRDAALNPVMIVVEYESDDRSQSAWTYGGRAAAKIGTDSELGVTRIHEGGTGKDASLTAVDARLQLAEFTRARVEFATSERNTPTGPQSGQAYSTEVLHDDGKFAARAYASEQRPGFGLGQQAAAAEGQRKVGADARVKVSDALQVQGEAYRQDDLARGGQRQVAEGRVQWSDQAGLTLSGGARIAQETDAGGAQSEARQVTAGVGYETMERRLVLRASTELDVGSKGNGTVNFPNRVLLGADYRLTTGTTLFAQQEFARGAALKADTTRFGVRSELWTGAEAQLGLGNQATLDAGRLFTNMGLVQKIKLGERWSADAGIDRVQTLRSTANPLGPAQPPASGTPDLATAGLITGDYTAVTLGLAYHDTAWSGNGRVEWRNSDTDTKVNLLLGAQRQLGQGRVVAAALTLNTVHGATETRNLGARLSYAFRPNDSNLIWLDRLDYVEDANRSLGARLFTRKLINNFNANWKASRQTQVAVQYSAKYVREMLGDTSYSGYTDLFGVEVRHDLGERWDIGLHAGALHSWRTGAFSYHLGASVGFRLADNTWLSVGYNQLGFSDPDFSGAEFRGKGLYVNVRVKFDQDTFDLNDRAKGHLPLKP